MKKNKEGRNSLGTYHFFFIIVVLQSCLGARGKGYSFQRTFLELYSHSHTYIHKFKIKTMICSLYHIETFVQSVPII